MARAKGIYILMMEVNILLNFFFVIVFSKKIENMFYVFLLSCRNTHGSLKEKNCGNSISHSPKLPLVFL